ERDKRLARHRNTQATHDSVSHTVTEDVRPHVALSESDFIAMQLGTPSLCAAENVSSLWRPICVRPNTPPSYFRLSSIALRKIELKQQCRASIGVGNRYSDLPGDHGEIAFLTMSNL